MGSSQGPVGGRVKPGARRGLDRTDREAERVLNSIHNNLTLSGMAITADRY